MYQKHCQLGRRKNPPSYTKVLKTRWKPVTHNRQKVYYAAINEASQVPRNNYQLKRLQSFSLLKFQLTCHPWTTFNSSSQQLVRAKNAKRSKLQFPYPCLLASDETGEKKRTTILHIPAPFSPTGSPSSLGTCARQAAAEGNWPRSYHCHLPTKFGVNLIATPKLSAEVWQGNKRRRNKWRFVSK